MSYLSNPGVEITSAATPGTNDVTNTRDGYTDRTVKYGSSKCPDPSFFQILKEMQIGSEEPGRIPIEKIVRFNFRKDNIQEIDPTELALEFTRLVGKAGEGSKYSLALNVEIKLLLDTLWDHASGTNETRSIRASLPQLEVEIEIQVQKTLSIKERLFTRHKEKVVCYFTITSTPSSENGIVEKTQTVYCCGKATSVRFRSCCGIHWALELKSDKEHRGKQFLNKVKNWGTPRERDFDDEKEHLLMT